MKQLFICSTEYQLFTALNMKYHLFPSESTDIIIQFLKSDTPDFYYRVQATELFTNVCYRLPYAFNLHEYAKRLRTGDFSGSFLGAASISAKQLQQRILSQTNHAYLANVRESIFNFDALDFLSYQQVFAGGTNDVVLNILKYLRFANPQCQLVGYEEGVGSYVVDDLGADKDNMPMDIRYLYEPTLATYTRSSFKRIPKVRRDDTAFIRILNQVFDYRPQKKEIKNKLVFFDNPAKPMPKYLQMNEFLSQTLFRNAYKKHLRDQGTYLWQLNAYKILERLSMGREILVKLHPREERANVEKDYAGQNTIIMDNLSVPWEVFCCNCDINNNVFITLSSSAVLSDRLTVEGENENLVIILNGYVSKGLSEYKFQGFFQKVQALSQKDDIYLPRSEGEYEEILNKILCK